MTTITISFLFFWVLWAAIVVILRKTGFKNSIGTRQQKTISYHGQNTVVERSLFIHFFIPILPVMTAILLPSETMNTEGKAFITMFLVIYMFSYLYLLSSSKDRAN